MQNSLSDWMLKVYWDTWEEVRLEPKERTIFRDQMNEVYRLELLVEARWHSR